MAMSVNTRMSMELWRILTGELTPGASAGARSSGKYGNAGASAPLFSDHLVFQAGDTVLKLAVRKMQETVNSPVRLANGQTFSGALGAPAGPAQLRVSQTATVNVSQRIGGSFRIFQPVKRPEATAEQIERGVAAAGGRDALSPWLVDGKSKIHVDGQSMVVQVDPAAAAEETADPEAAAVAALARFGFGADRLGGDFNQLRSDLRQAAAEAESANDPALSHAIEYALEDAFARVRAIEDARNGVSPTAFDDQLAKNKEQGASITDQLQLGASSSWSMDSAAEDLAVFGKDMTALGEIGGLAGELDEMYRQKTEDLKNRYVGTEFEYRSEIRRLDGALSRLRNGVAGSAATASAAASGSATITVDGVAINASSVMSVVTVIADPLVFDLNGDGIALKSAEDGVDFDMDGDGQKTRTGFIQGDDAFLFYNESGEDAVTDGRQLFGNADGHANGFEKLRSFDENGDGVIDENDDIYGKLRLWQDKNGDGACDGGEALTLAGAGIESIRVDYENVREDDGTGNLIGQTGSFSRTDGSQGFVADVWLRELTGRA